MPSTVLPPRVVEPIIYGSSTVAYTPLSNSPSSVTKSQDGQYAIVTRDEIHLLTAHLPKPTLSPTETGKKKKGKDSKGKGKAKQTDEQEQGEEEEGSPSKKKKRSRQLDWEFTKTSIKINKKTKDDHNLLKWSEWLDDSEIVTPGQVELFWKSTSFSPSGLSSKLGGCVLACLNTNCEVTIYEPTKDGEKGEWKETFDITSQIVHELINPNLPKIYETNSSTRRSLAHLLSKAQATCIAWSPPLPSTSTVPSRLDGSILSIGHKSGEISLWRYNNNNSSTTKAHCLKRFRPTNTSQTSGQEVNWINLLKWNSKWKWIEQPGGGKFEIELAIGDSDGRVWLETITQKIENDNNNNDNSEDVEMKDTIEGEEEFLVEIENCLEIVGGQGDRRKVSQFCFWKNHLGFTKLGTLNIVTLSKNENEVLRIEKNQEIELGLPTTNTQEGGGGSWNGTSNWSSCSGLIYSNDSLQVYLSCGLVYHLDLSLGALPPSLSPSSNHTVSSRQLYQELVLNRTSKFRSTNESEGGGDLLDQTQTPIRRGQSQKINQNQKLSKNEGPRILGVVPISEGGGRELMGIVFEKDRPDLFEYHPNSTVKTFFSIFKHSDRDEQEEDVLKSIENVIYEEETNALDSPPHQSLLPILDSLSLFSNSQSFVESLLETLSRPLPSTPIVQNLSTQPEQQEVESIEERVIQSLYRDESLEIIRKKFTTISRLPLHPDIPTNLKPRVDKVSFSIERELISLVVSKICKLLSNTRNLSEFEKVYLTRLLLASSALPPPPSSEVEDQQQQQSADSLTTTFELPESNNSKMNNNNCPACSSSVPFGNVRTATCLERGHVWERCSITLELVSTVKVRTCSNCQRKGLLKVTTRGEEENESSSSSSLERINQLLEAVKCCAFCGGRWLKVR